MGPQQKKLLVKKSKVTPVFKSTLVPFPNMRDIFVELFLEASHWLRLLAFFFNSKL